MKFTRFISFSIISAVSIGTLVGFTSFDDSSIDRTFKIEDLTGNRNVLDDIVLSNIVKVDANSFEKVEITNNEVIFTDTQFDEMYQVGEQVLNNKDVYRGNVYAISYENDGLLLTASFNNLFPYASDEPYVTIAKKDKITNDVIKEKINLSGLMNDQQVWNETLTEIKGEIFYSILAVSNNEEQKPMIHIYKMNQDNLQLEEMMNVNASLSSDSYTNVSSIESDGTNLYVVLTNEQESKLLKINPLTGESEQFDLPTFEYIDNFDVDEEYFYVYTEAGLSVINEDALKSIQVKAFTPSFTEKYDYVFTVEQKKVKDILYVLYEAGMYEGDSENYIVAYDLSNGKVSYEGKLPSMENRGVGTSYTLFELE